MIGKLERDPFRRAAAGRIQACPVSGEPSSLPYRLSGFVPHTEAWTLIIFEPGQLGRAQDDAMPGTGQNITNAMGWKGGLP
jgi:hypothetical protein